MSMHKIPLTKVEEEGLKAHGLDIGTPSQLSDVFRQGVAWGCQKRIFEGKSCDLVIRLRNESKNHQTIYDDDRRVKIVLMEAADKIDLLRDACNVALGHMTGGMDGDWRDCDVIQLLRDVVGN